MTYLLHFLYIEQTCIFAAEPLPPVQSALYSDLKHSLQQDSKVIGHSIQNTKNMLRIDSIFSNEIID